MMAREGLFRFVASAHGIYYVLTGVFPLVSMRTFELITGPKQDDWLVQTVGALVAVVGVVFITAAVRQTRVPEVFVLGIGSAFVFALVDAFFWATGVISAIYLLDAAAEVLLIGGWLLAWYWSSVPLYKPGVAPPRE